MAVLERKRWTIDAWKVTPQQLQARREVDRIDRDRLIVDALEEGMTQTEAAERFGISQATVHRTARRTDEIKAEREDPPPLEVITRYWAGQLTHEELMADLLARTYVEGHIPEGSYDAYVRGSWDQVEHAYLTRLLTREEFEQVREHFEA